MCKNPVVTDGQEKLLTQGQPHIIKVGTKELEKETEITKDHAVVIVNYVDEQGLPIASTVVDSVELKGSAYDTTDNKPQSIEFNGKTYELVKVKDGDFEKGNGFNK